MKFLTVTVLNFLLACFVLPAAAKTIATGTMPSRGVGAELPFTVYAADEEKPGTGAFPAGSFPLAVYMKNLSIERIGTASDDEIIAGILKQGILVAVVDYQGKAFPNDGAVLTEYFNNKAWFGSASVFGSIPGRFEWKKDIRDRMPYGSMEKPEPTAPAVPILTFQAGGKDYRVSVDEVYVLPEGYTVHRGMDRGPNGNASPPCDRFFMDLILPVRPKSPVPLIIEQCTTNVRSPETKVAVNPNTPFLMSYTYFGYGLAALPHVAEAANGKGESGYGGQAPINKAIRMFRAEKEKWGLTGKIGISAISKSAQSVLLAAARRPGDKPLELTPELLKTPPYSQLFNGESVGPLVKDLYERSAPPGRFEQHEREGRFKIGTALQKVAPAEFDLGPYANQSDRPDAAMSLDLPYPALVQIMRYVNKDLPPLCLGFGALVPATQVGGTRPNISPDAAIGYRLLRDVLKQVGARNYFYYEQENLGHEYNHFKYSEIRAFFDTYCKAAK